MPHSIRGRTLYVEFKCKRCGKVHLEPYDKQYNATTSTDIEHLDFFNPPKGWKNEFGFPLICDECNEQYKAFMTEFWRNPLTTEAE